MLEWQRNYRRPLIGKFCQKMFDIEFSAPISNEKTDDISQITYSDVTVANSRIWKLSPAFSQMTWDFPLLDPARSNTILILAIPPGMTPTGVMEYVNRTRPGKFRLTIVHSVLNSAIVEFESQRDADVFYIHSLGEPFDRECPMVRCISLFLARITPNIGITPVTRINADWIRDFSLPTCPICFELFDAPVSTLFHFTSLGDISKEAYYAWGSHKCAACMSRDKPCDDCGCEKSLWICLDCGHVGCGRDKNCHGLSHHEETKHRFAFMHQSNWLWDYVGVR